MSPLAKTTLHLHSFLSLVLPVPITLTLIVLVSFLPFFVSILTVVLQACDFAETRPELSTVTQLVLAGVYINSLLAEVIKFAGSTLAPMFFLVLTLRSISLALI